jgi:hypothetical protein
MFWFSSAYLLIGGLLSWEWAWRCGLINLIIGMLGLLLITRTAEGDRLFYLAPRVQQKNSRAIIMLWSIPIVVLFIASIWWMIYLLEMIDW